MEGDKPKKTEWPGGPTVARKSTTHTLADYVDWLRQVETKYGPGRAGTLQRLRRLYYSKYTGGAGPGFDKVINNTPGADGPPMTSSDLPLAVINGLYETNAIVTPNGSLVDISHIFADLDLHVQHGGLKAGGAELRFGVNFEGVFTWVGDLASWWLEAKNAIAKRGGAVEQAVQVSVLLSLAASKVAKDDLLGDIDAQVMADQFTTTTVAPVPEGPAVIITTQNMPLSQMLMQYYGNEPTVGQGQQSGTPGRVNTPTSSNRFHYFVVGARPLIPHTRVAERPLTVALAADAPAKIREHLTNTARMFVDDNPPSRYSLGPHDVRPAARRGLCPLLALPNHRTRQRRRAMALIELPPNSGLPAWAANGYDVVATIVVAAAVGSVLAGVVARLVPGRGVGHRLHAIAIVLTVTLFAGWAVAAVLGSTAPHDGQFCLTPEYFTGQGPTTCASRGPIWLLMAPLAVLLALAVAGLSMALPSCRRWTIMGLLAFVVAVAAMRMDGAVALVEPGMFNGGGITTLREAVERLVVDEPARVGLGLLLAGVLVIVMLVQRSERKRNPPPVELPTAKSHP